MALAFYITDMAHGKSGNNAVTLALRDTAASTKDIPASFMQTSELTSAFVGVTDYGTYIANSQASLPAGGVAIKALELETGSIYQAPSIALGSVLDGFFPVGTSFAVSAV